MYWAKELQFGNNTEHTLNYNIRALGRRGVLVLNAVAPMDQLQPVEASMAEVLKFVGFNEGHRYANYVPGADRLAAYGIGALIAGTVAAKAGFFKLLIVGLIAAKKLVLVGFAALAAFLRRVFKKKEAVVVAK